MLCPSEEIEIQQDLWLVSSLVSHWNRIKKNHKVHIKFLTKHYIRHPFSHSITILCNKAYEVWLLPFVAQTYLFINIYQQCLQPDLWQHFSKALYSVLCHTLQNQGSYKKLQHFSRTFQGLFKKQIEFSRTTYQECNWIRIVYIYKFAVQANRYMCLTL